MLGLFFPISVESAIGILIGIALNLYIVLGSLDILTILILPVREHGISFHFICVFDFFHQCLNSFRCIGLSPTWLNLVLSILFYLFIYLFIKFYLFIYLFFGCVGSSFLCEDSL